MDDGEAATAYGDVRRRRGGPCVHGRRHGELNPTNQGKIEARVKRLDALPCVEANELDLVDDGDVERWIPTMNSMNSAARRCKLEL